MTGRRCPTAATTAPSSHLRAALPRGERGGNRRGSHIWLAGFGWPTLASLVGNLASRMAWRGI
ncbi:Os09g0478900 [Oryza sativa Japonica Group]|uniref:Os09g0478900 protein n=1 Tax=Oryza sativa subsp. japonica TaxID=39947 RepID=A0A0P0XP24_ORYSJ|nr:Os09g0478900 [Oryza sativa Japonica Group]